MGETQPLPLTRLRRGATIGAGRELMEPRRLGSSSVLVGRARRDVVAAVAGPRGPPAACITGSRRSQEVRWNVLGDT
jgi:hypothetical protein